jgi:mRNA-degrading endonuclease toxin of MazEF toxin-antitoxin module
MRRGDVCWATLEPRSGSEQRGRRPVVVMSHDSFNQVPTWRSVIVVPVTTSSRRAASSPTVVSLPSTETGLPADSYAICHQITTIDRRKLGAPTTTLGSAILRAVESGILEACDIQLDIGAL